MQEAECNVKAACSSSRSRAAYRRQLRWIGVQEAACRVKAACRSRCSKAACRRQLQREGSMQEVVADVRRQRIGGSCGEKAACRRQLL